MAAGQHINGDGTVKEEILAMQELAKMLSAQKHRYERSYIDRLIEEGEKNGFVILLDDISKELIENIKRGAGTNNTNMPRMSATTQYCEPWARQQENYSLAISRQRAKGSSETIQKLLGYSMQFPFIGFVIGRDPIRLLQD